MIKKTFVCSESMIKKVERFSHNLMENKKEAGIIEK